MDMTAGLKRLVDPQRMLKPEQVVGEIPPAGKIYRKMYDIAWPSTVESVLIGLVGMVDTMMVGRLGSGAIAAVGITNQPRLIALSVIMALNVAVTAVVSRRTGQKDMESANRCLRQTLTLTVLLTALFAGLCFAFARPLLTFAGAGSDTIDDAVIYFQITMAGLIFNTLTMTINAAWRGTGRTKISMTTNLTANLVNVVFNYLLINGKFGFPRLEVAGAAIATVIGSFVGFVMAAVTLFKKDAPLSLRSKVTWKFDKATMNPVMDITASAFIEQVFMRIGFFLYAKIVASLGTDDFATHQICMNIMSLSFTFGNGLQAACTALVGQSLGAKRPDMAMIYVKVGQRIGFLLSCMLASVIYFGARWLMGLFTTEEDIIVRGIPLLTILSITCFAQISQIVYSGCLRGAGDTRYVAFVSMISIMMVRPGLSWLLCYPVGIGLIGAWWGVLIDQYLRWVFTMIRFAGGKWTKIKV